MGKSGSYFELTGLAAARIEVRAFRVVIIPALAIETVCCSFLGGVRKVMKRLAWFAYHDFMQDAPRRV